MATDTKDALVRAAQQSFGTHGYDGTSIRHLAATVGIKESSVYKHFPSKQAILDAVLERARTQMSSLAATLGLPFAGSEGDVQSYARVEPEVLQQGSAALLAAWLHDDEVVVARRCLTLEQYRSPEVGRSLWTWLWREPLAAQTQLFAQLIDAGHFAPADPEAVALAFWGPILAILMAAEGVGEAEARAHLDHHLAHFTATHLARETP